MALFRTIINLTGMNFFICGSNLSGGERGIMAESGRVIVSSQVKDEFNEILSINDQDKPSTIECDRMYLCLTNKGGFKWYGF